MLPTAYHATASLGQAAIAPAQRPESALAAALRDWEHITENLAARAAALNESFQPSPVPAPAPQGASTQSGPPTFHDARSARIAENLERIGSELQRLEARIA